MSAVRWREEAERDETRGLAPFAQSSAASRGRLHAEDEHAYRTAFARDRDRVVHSRAFRRLQYKTQVFVPHEGDHYRNRLTHTLEGSQIARTLARTLRLNENLAEAIVLAHDLGHTAFGHAGERVLDELMAEDGGFDHNRQTLRIVDWLEDRYPAFPGLNLTWETREGILKHGCRWPHPVPVPDIGPQPSLEAQLADLADEIAYLNHDLDDGLRSGLLDPAQLDDVALWAETAEPVVARLGAAVEPAVRHAQGIIAIINRLVTDLVQSTARALDRLCPQDVDAVRGTQGRIVKYSTETGNSKRQLKEFLYEALYQHPAVAEVSARSAQALAVLFAHYRADPARLPAHVVARLPQEGEARAIADYIAGMTDRYALAEVEKLSHAG